MRFWWYSLISFVFRSFVPRSWNSQHQLPASRIGQLLQRTVLGGHHNIIELYSIFSLFPVLRCVRHPDYIVTGESSGERSERAPGRVN